MPVNLEGIHHLLSHDGDVGRHYAERAAVVVEMAKLSAPIRPEHAGEHLVDAIAWAWESESNLNLLIGTHPDEDIRGYSVIVQTGSKPHPIVPRPPTRFLKFKTGGRTVYRKRVFHPGTQANDFLIRLIGEIVH